MSTISSGSESAGPVETPIFSLLSQECLDHDRGQLRQLDVPKRRDDVPVHCGAIPCQGRRFELLHAQRPEPVLQVWRSCQAGDGRREYRFDYEVDAFLEVIEKHYQMKPLMYSNCRFYDVYLAEKPPWSLGDRRIGRSGSTSGTQKRRRRARRPQRFSTETWLMSGTSSRALEPSGHWGSATDARLRTRR